MVKIAIVGPQEDKWTETQKYKARQEILHLFIDNAKEPIGVTGLSIKDFDFSNITLVSGHCPKGGVDIWAEEIADTLSIKKEIFKPEVNQWNDKEVSVAGYNHYQGRDIETEAEYTLMGYKSRNIKIAETCDVLYCIVPFNDKIQHTCMQHKIMEYPYHPQNGGCWTMKYTKKLGKETHLVVVE